MDQGDWKAGLAPDVTAVLDQVIADASEALGSALEAIVLFGSAAEGRLRATSDVNIIFVLKTFDSAAAGRWRASLQASAAAIDLQPMLLLSAEIEDAAEAFAVKFSDVAARRRVLFGADPFATLAISREATLRRVRQVLLNMAMRLRHAALLFNEVGQTRAIVDAIGPLRASAMVLLNLEGRRAESPREALEILAQSLGAQAQSVIAQARELREHADKIQPQGPEELLALSGIAAALLERSKELR